MLLSERNPTEVHQVLQVRIGWLCTQLNTMTRSGTSSQCRSECIRCDRPRRANFCALQYSPTQVRRHKNARCSLSIVTFSAPAKKRVAASTSDVTTWFVAKSESMRTPNTPSWYNQENLEKYVEWCLLWIALMKEKHVILSVASRHKYNTIKQEDLRRCWPPRYMAYLCDIGLPWPASQAAAACWLLQTFQ